MAWWMRFRTSVNGSRDDLDDYQETWRVTAWRFIADPMNKMYTLTDERYNDPVEMTEDTVVLVHQAGKVRLIWEIPINEIPAEIKRDMWNESTG